MKNQSHRSAAEIRIDFKSLAVQAIPLPILLEKLDRLRIEVHQCVATSYRNTGTLNEYLKLLADIELWSRDRREVR